jgi:hypothetical protein
MSKPTDRAAPIQPLDILIAEALDATQMLPRPEHCEILNRQLRAAIGDLYLAAQQQLPEHAERSRGWYRIQNMLDATNDVLAGDLGSGLLSAALHLAALGRQAQALDSLVAGTP